MSQSLSPKLIAVDSCSDVLQAIKAIASPHYHVMMTGDHKKALEWIEKEQDVAIIAAELLLVGASGLELLKTAMKIKPKSRRVLLTSFADLAPVIEGLHCGAIQLFVQKPIRAEELAKAILPRLAA